MEIRLHGRGGQGGVTCAKILAAVYARKGKSVQTFGEYAAERSGAPVRAYTRIADTLITNRNKVYTPDHLLVLDPTLLGNEIVSGLKPGGILLLNTPDNLEAFKGRFESYVLGIVDATAIARRHKIGTRSVVIVNTTIAGDFIKAIGLQLGDLEEAYKNLGLLSNFEAAREAFAAVITRPAMKTTAPEQTTGSQMAQLPNVLPLTEHTESPPTGLKTGSWRTQSPRYVENLAPCNAWCPAGNDVVGFIQSMVGNSDEKSASEILGRSTPLAAVCGRVCPAPCMEGCNRREYDGSVNIRALERLVADNEPVAKSSQGANKSSITNHQHKQKQNCSFAIVGGGPAGLSAAYQLAKAGQSVTLFEKEHALGGVLRTGIPAFRLPRDVLDREINDILSFGVEVNHGQELSESELQKLSAAFDALIITTGLSSLTDIKIKGREESGVIQGIDFLHSANLGGGTKLSGHVVVLGGGNTAIDCARSALRCGASQVTVAYRRTEAEMPAIKEEVDEARHEKVSFLFQRQPIAFNVNGAKHKVTQVELAVVKMGEPDESGRRRPIVTDQRECIDCDYVILALGQSADRSILPSHWELNDCQILASGKAINVFAAGDFATGEGTVTHAIGSGRRAATLALRALGFEITVFERPDRTKAVPITDIRLDHFAKSAPSIEPTRAEASRCFSCGHCTTCDTCLVYCPEGIINRQGDVYEADYSYCKGCGICVAVCPRKAIEMVNL